MDPHRGPSVEHRADEAVGVANREGLGEVVALAEDATEVDELTRLGLGLDAFGDHADADQAAISRTARAIVEPCGVPSSGSTNDLSSLTPSIGNLWMCASEE